MDSAFKNWWRVLVNNTLRRNPPEVQVPNEIKLYFEFIYPG